MYKRKRAGNTITRKINSTKDTAAKADKNHYISNSYLEGFIPIDTEYFTASSRWTLFPTALPLFDPEVCYFPKKAYTSPLPPQKAGPSFLCRNSSPFLFIPEFIEIMAY